jgi:hypothetical protein
VDASLAGLGFGNASFWSRMLNIAETDEHAPVVQGRRSRS